MICLESLTRGRAKGGHVAFLETSPVSDILFWESVLEEILTVWISVHDPYTDQTF